MKISISRVMEIKKDDAEECFDHTAAIKKEGGFNFNNNPVSSFMILIPEDCLASYGSSSYSGSSSCSTSLQLIKDYKSDDKYDDSSKEVVEEEKKDDIGEKKVKVYTCLTKEQAEEAEKAKINTCANKDEATDVEVVDLTSFEATNVEVVESFNFFVDEDVTSYGGITIKLSDVNSLKGAHFLSDNVIGFYFSCLVSQFQLNDVYLVSPSVSYLLASLETSDSTVAIVTPLQLCEKKVIVFPVNDARGFNSEGIHWSLLVYHKEKNAFYHHDSMKGQHMECAHRFYNKLKRLLCPRRPFFDLRTDMMGCSKKRKNKMGFGMDYIRFLNFEDEYDAPFKDEHFTPQQTNYTDCGLFVMEFARVICRWYASEPRNEDELWLRDFEMISTFDVQYLMRDKVQELIQASKNGELNLEPPQ